MTILIIIVVVFFLWRAMDRYVPAAPPVVDVTPILPRRARQHRSRKNKRRTTGGWSGAVAL